MTKLSINNDAKYILREREPVRLRTRKIAGAVNGRNRAESRVQLHKLHFSY